MNGRVWMSALLCTIFWMTLLTTADERYAAQAQALCTNPYTVQRGDGWIKIANRCGVAYGALRAANADLWRRRGENLRIGDQLTIPGAATPATVTAPASTPTPSPTPPPNPTLTATDSAAQTGETARRTVEAFWQAVRAGVRTGDFRAAYSYLSPARQSVWSYSSFKDGFATTRTIEIESLNLVEANATSATIDSTLLAADQLGDGLHYRHFLFRYRLTLVDGAWRLDTLQLLSSIPATGCPDAYPTRLQKGGRAYVLPQPPTPNRVREAPSRQATVTGQVRPGERMTIIDGPRCADGWVWWYIQSDRGVSGWTSEGQAGEYWLAPLGPGPAPAPTATRRPPAGPLVESITFCTQVDQSKRCLAPATQFPIGLDRIEVNWSFRNLPLQSRINHRWYHNGNLFYERAQVLWDANRRNTSGNGYTYYAPLGGLPTGQWRLEFRRASDNLLLQSASFTVGATAPGAAADFSGSWQTNFAFVTLQQRGNQVMGSYVRYGRQQPTTLSGTVAGNRLTGRNESGTAFTFTLNADANSFDGQWMGRDGVPRHWCGVRNGPLPPGCGFSGWWQTRVGGDQGWIELEQSGTYVSGHFFDGHDNGVVLGQVGQAGHGADPMYSVYGDYQLRGTQAKFRLDLVNYNSDQFQGCWRNNTRQGEWCGWREDGHAPAQCQAVAPCP
ncbi:MAG: SH3 domain-containing protein [Caldilineaceae bacterium]